MEETIKENIQQMDVELDSNKEKIEGVENNAINEKFIKTRLKMRIINKNDKNDDVINKIKNLYYSAFPKKELYDFEDLLCDIKGKKIFSFFDEKVFVGFAIIITKNKICNILYLAIESELRGKGYGTQALKKISNFYKNNRIVVDVEDPDKTENKKEERLKRINFYLKAGFKLTNIKYLWEDEYYIIMVINGNITENEFWNFWNNR